jgi:NADH:ubiquinone oxidoreductase subunit H
VAEVNRAPFDLAEGERELIRGFNIELRGVLLALVLVREYGLVIVFRWLTRALFLMGTFMVVGVILLFSLFLRRVLPRYRYDKLMAFCWTKVLPMVLFFIIIVVSARHF